VVFSPELAPATAELASKQKLSFPILYDADNKIAEAFGLAFTLPEDLKTVYLGFGLDLPKRNGDPSWRLPMPARFVIDRSGIVRSVDCDPDYTRRPEPETTVAALRHALE